MIFYKFGYYIISNINGNKIKIDNLFSKDETMIINYSEDIQIPIDSNKSCHAIVSSPQVSMTRTLFSL